VLVCGCDGYIGWMLTQHLLNRGHEVFGVDNQSRRRWVAEVGSCSAIPIQSFKGRCAMLGKTFGWSGYDLREYPMVAEAFRVFEPEAVVHLGECPSAPYSMIDAEHATFVQTNNVVSTLNLLYAMRDLAPEASLIKMGTMGEYGQPNVDIPEGFFDVEYRGRADRLPFPRQAGSWYHWSKVHDSYNCWYATRIWDLRCTDLMQGVVYGTRAPGCGLERGEEYATRFDFDEAFGTAIHRFCCQAVVGHPITVYGSGRQRRGFISLRDALTCITLAVEKPPAKGEYRVLNEFDRVYSVRQLATEVADVSGVPVEVREIDNPRVEKEDHYYNPDHQGLADLGYRPTSDLGGDVRRMLDDLQPHAQRIRDHAAVLDPEIRWRR
jgi:UDP-sulfoquinovose synthase